MRPSEGGINPAMRRSKVLLPQPDGPKSERNAPGATPRSMPASAAVPLRKVLLISATSTIGAADAAALIAAYSFGYSAHPDALIDEAQSVALLPIEVL